MTNEEAIKVLNMVEAHGLADEAKQMAISALNSLEEVYAKGYNDGFTQAEINFENDKALSQEPCDDAISRDAVREILSKYHLGESRIAEELNELPSVQRTSNADKKHVENTLDDAISRETLIAKLTELIKTSRSTIEIKAKLIPMIQNMPSVTQKSGKWITEEIGEGRKVYCSECKESAVFEYVRDGDIYSSYGHGVVKKTKYCPNCGARMERGDKE